MKVLPNPILVTGVAGFIGYSLAKKLIEEGNIVIGIDNINSYYSVSLKKQRLKILNKLSTKSNFHFHEISISAKSSLDKICHEYSPKIIINLAAQAGVRYSITNPSEYIESNLVGFSNILEVARKFRINHLIYASSSSVYGGNSLLPFSEKHNVNHPISLYAATKKSNELLAHSYSHLYNLPCTGLRFFTVYGPWGRPDMAPMIFSNAILKGEILRVFNNGRMSRDFTFIDDVLEAIIKCCYKPPIKNDLFDKSKPDPSSSFAPFKILNVGNNKVVELMYFIKLLEKNFGKKAIIQFEPLQDGDVISTYADLTEIKKWINFSPSTSIEKGIEKFSKWYINYFYNQDKNND